MGVRSRLRSWLGLTETTPAPVDGAVAAPRKGFEYGVPALGTNTTTATAESSERQQILNQLHQAYLTCPWVSAPIDLVGRTVTAGGLQLEYDTTADASTGADIPPEPAEVTRLRRLMRFVNPREDMVQLLRQTVIDLELFGDAYLEVVTLLGEPVAIYTLDATTMTVITDPHGEVSGYVQLVDGIRKAEFSTDEVIHISLDSPRGGVYGVSWVQKALLPVTAWLFTEATIKECFRQGDPPRIHADLGAAEDTDVQNWREQYKVFNLGPKAIGTPVITTRKGEINVLDPRKVMDYLAASKQLRDEIVACSGVPPAKLTIIESGNLGGGTHEGQDKTFRVDKIIPIAALILEKLNYHVGQLGFGITDWQLQFGEIDYRDSKTVEEIRDMRLRNGSFTLNRYRDEIGEPPVQGGDDAVLVNRQEFVLWADIAAMSKAQVATQQATTPPAAATAGPDAALPPDDRPGGANDATQGEPPQESVFTRDTRKLDEAWQHAYRARRRAALKDLPPVEVA